MELKWYTRKKNQLNTKEDTNRKIKKQKQSKTNRKQIEKKRPSLFLSVITLNINGIKTSINRKRLIESIKKYELYCL